MSKPIVLIAEELSPATVEALGPDFEIRQVDGADRVALLPALKDAHAVLIRSATKMDEEALKAAPSLKVIARAGVGLDNVDIRAATNQGVMVVNAPTSNVISAAELAIGHIMSLARNIPAAQASMQAGKWQRSAFSGVELYEKTIGIIGLGRIGKLVATRAAAFGMRIVAFDPYISAERARQLNIEIMPLDQLVAESDFLTVHLPKNKETIGIIGREMFLKAKPELRVINVARGGIIDEEALATAVKEGLIAGAALDVFTKEPMTESPLFSIPQIVVNPHLGASTREAQDKAGDVIADMVQLALAGDFVPFAVNIDASDANETLRPFLPLAERLGQLFASLVGKTPSSLEISATGDIGGYDTRILTLSALKGFFASITGEQVTYVNAPQLAKDAGCEVRENNSPISTNADYVNLVTLKCDGHNIAATLVGPRREARLVLVDDHITDVPPANNMLVVRNDDRPGVIGVVGTLLGNATVNIADMDVGKALKAGTAVMVIVPTATVAPEVISALRAAPGILDVAVLTAS